MTETKTEYRIELVWNREFQWASYGKPSYPDFNEAKRVAWDILYSGDGARVKRVRVLDDNDKVVWSA